MIRSSFVVRGLVLASCLAWSGEALAKTKVACVGEQTTHSLHRENDPEYPFLMAKQLDADFVATTLMAPHGGGFLEGGGTNFTVGNFGHPQASVLNHDQTDPRTYLKSEEFPLLVAFKPDLVVLGPFGWHDVLSNVPLANFPKDMDALILAVQAIDSKPRIALATPVPEGGADKADGFTQIDALTRAAATQHQLPIIDVWQELSGKASLFQDDFHLTVEGRTHLATFVGNSVKTLAAAPPTMGGAGGAGGSAGASGKAGTSAGGAGGGAGEQPFMGGSGGATPGTAGVSTGGASSAGGSASTSAGTTSALAGSAANPLDGSAPETDAGCGCRAAPRAPMNAVGWLLALGSVLALRRRRPAHK